MSLSAEEFQRFQNQLLELKTDNYQLNHQNKNLAAENVQLKTQIETLEKRSINLPIANIKLPSLIRKNAGRDAGEIQRENQALTNAVKTQEEGFRLQNETLMQELNKYMSKVEELENELKSYKEGRRTSLNNSQEGNELNQVVNEDIRRLKAENTVLQKKLSELSSKVVESISTASSSNESFQKEDIEVEYDDNRSDAGLVHIVSNKTTNGETKPFDTNSIRLETEQEEKRLLQEQLHQCETTLNETNSKFSKQIENLKEKLDEKQNTCLQLQHDYEKRIQEIIAENSNMKKTNELQTDVLKSDIKRLHEEVQTLTKTKDEEIAKYQKRTNDLQATVDQLESQIGTVAAEQNLQLRTTNAEHQRILEDKELLLNQTILDRDFLRTETEQSKEAYETLLQTVQTLEEQLTTKTREHESQLRLAEQRKSTIDEMAANSLQVEEKNKTFMKNLKEKYENDISKFEQENTDLKNQNRSLKQYQTRCTNLENRLKSEEESKQSLTTSVEQLQIKINELKENYEKRLSDLQIEHEKILNDEKVEHQKEIQNFEESLCANARTIEELNAQNDLLKQDAETFQDDKRAHERKGTALMKDLQKQLNVERKKNELLQQRLTELLPSDRTGLDELFSAPRTGGSRQGDTESVSSFGGGASFIDRVSVHSTQFNTSSLEVENKELAKNLDRVKNECAILKERVQHLESSSSSMANDLIQRYSQDRRSSTISTNHSATPPPSRRRQPSNDRQLHGQMNIRNFIGNLGGHRTQSTNDDTTIRNLQRALEETLTKNVHLQNDLAAMSSLLQQQQSSPNQ